MPRPSEPELRGGKQRKPLQPLPQPLAQPRGAGPGRGGEGGRVRPHADALRERIEALQAQLDQATCTVEALQQALSHGGRGGAGRGFKAAWRGSDLDAREA